MSCAKGATVIKLSAAAVAVVCASSALFGLVSPVSVLSVEANSGPPWEEGVTADGIYSLHEDSVLEVQSEVLTFDISSLPSDIAEGKNYDARVTAEYTFYNPTDEYVTTAMAFPFGIRPYYAEELEVTEISDPIKIDGKTADYQIRHTYGKYGEFEKDVHGILPDYMEDDFYSPETPERINYYGGGKNTPYVLVYVAIIILPILGLVLLAIAAGLVIRFNRKKKIKGSLNSDNIGNDDGAK